MDTSEKDLPLTFVVGTGRCGSTALSQILKHHPAVLSLNELLTSVGTEAIPDATMSGVEFWRLLADPNPVFDAMILAGVPLPEFLYTRSPGRFAAGTTGIPALSLMALPHLTHDPDALLDELRQHVSRWSPAPVAAHYASFFELLCARFGRQVVVERSGYSLHWVPRLRKRFPSARFVHLFRDGPDCALSMSKHPGLRVILLRHRIMDRLGVSSLSELTSRDVDSLPPELAGIFPDRLDPDVVWQPLPLSAFGELWSRLISEGLRDLAEVADSDRMSLSYENLHDDTDAELARLATFLDVESGESWLDSARQLLDVTRRGASTRLPPDELDRLRESCAPGIQALQEYRQSAPQRA